MSAARDATICAAGAAICGAQVRRPTAAFAASCFCGPQQCWRLAGVLPLAAHAALPAPPSA
eukprot:CAMPEP_0197924654 /NCGR_PEP_ID=MMETSP1439-20131203/96080_1 /TAXON_ID=66791 /ORGANISM="Gonyaulax spinifera, Strain CCMP409" /LENGTH=60 /DNA_ID=CAMNT_0043547093 /DNA_START=27 /DNA_END=206 /DNA_ORIENTATION=+